MSKEKIVKREPDKLPRNLRRTKIMKNRKKKKDMVITIQAWMGIIMYFVGLYTIVNRLATVLFSLSAWVAEKITQKKRITEDEKGDECE